MRLSIPFADLSFFQESILSIVTPKNLVDDTSGIGVSFILRISSSCWFHYLWTACQDFHLLYFLEGREITNGIHSLANFMNFQKITRNFGLSHF